MSNKLDPDQARCFVETGLTFCGARPNVLSGLICVQTVSKSYKQANLEGKELSQYLGLVATKPVFGVSDKARLKPFSSATETS